MKMGWNALIFGVQHHLDKKIQVLRQMKSLRC